ncbi:hypothetical protein RJD24_18815 [Bacillaceae bacterium IKA-2]|nr:hypothetical protein RJD24_18815 [Bacillaceae bacterium IKA-2]
MKTQTLRPFNSINFGRILHAIHARRSELKGSYRQLFDVMYKKVFGQGKEVELDGMEMKLIVTSLMKRGDFLEMIGKPYEADNFYKIASEVTLIRINFQRQHGPKIVKAPTAVTVSAMAYKAV